MGRQIYSPSVTGSKKRNSTALMRFLSLVMMVVLAALLWATIGPEMYSLSAANLKIIQLGGSFFPAYLRYGLVTAVV